jgi:HK97 family phage major capsid protein
MPNEVLTQEAVTKLVADGISAALKEQEAKKITTKFTPGMGEGNVTVTKDSADQPWPNMGEFLFAVMRAGSSGTPIREPRLKRSVPGAIDAITKAPTGLGEAVPSDGAFLVAQEFIPNLIDRIYDTSIVYGKCAKQPVGPNFNGVKIPAIDETSRADGSRWGGVRAYWAAEAASLTASQPKFRQISMELQKLIAMCYLTDELMEDSVALEGHVNTWFPMEMGFKLDDAIINGDGVGKPLGILSSGARVTVSKETNQIAATIVTNNILKMFRRMWGWSLQRGQPIWLVNQNTLEQLATMTIPIGTAGALANLFQFPVANTGSQFGAQPVGTMLNKPVYCVEQAATVGTEGDVIFFDPSQYIVAEKGGLKAASSIHVAFTTDQSVFRWIMRTQGLPVWASTLTPYKGTSDTISPYITLQTRS